MAIISALFNNNINNIFEAFNCRDVTSTEMKIAIEDCFNLYFGSMNTLEDDCQRLPVVIVNKITKAMFSEYDVSCKNEDDYISKSLEEIDAAKLKAMQYCLIGGECLLKPVPKAGKIEWMPIRRDCFVPLARDNRGNILSVGTAEFNSFDNHYYTLLEKRTVKNNRLQIENKLFISEDRYTLGSEISLDTLAMYADLLPISELPIDNIGMVQLKTPLLNDVDGSCDGIAVFEPARRLIHNINLNEQQMKDEFELLQARIVVSSDMLKTMPNGEKSLVDKLFTGLDDNPEDVGIMPFTPAFREQAYITRKNEYLRNIETLCGFKRGLLADINEYDKTATEITDSKGEYNLTIIDFQKVWDTAVRKAVELAGVIGKIYRITGAKEINGAELAIDFGDGILYNRDKQWGEILTMVQMGLLKPELALAWYYEEPHKTKGDLNNIKKKYMPDEQAETMQQNEIEPNEEPIEEETTEPVEPSNDNGELNGTNERTNR